MKPMLAVIVIFSFFVVSCKNKQEKNEHLILGNWHQSDSTTSQYWGFVFNSDKSFKDLSGFYKTNDQHKPIYTGNTSKYKIEGNTLAVFSPTDSTWKKWPIIKLTTDTLQLSMQLWKGSLDTITLTHFKSIAMHNPTFDKVIISYHESDKLRGNFIDMLVDKTGNVLYKDTSSGFKLFSGNISKDKYKQMINAFNLVDIAHLKKAYYPLDKVEHPWFNISFVKNNRIYKNIQDYDGVAPIQFISAYRPLIYLGNSLNLKQTPLPSYLQNMEDLYSMELESDSLTVSFTYPQRFLLFSYLKDGKLCSTSFKKRFLLKVQIYRQHLYPDSNSKASLKLRKRYSVEDKPSIATDGRYFTFIANGKQLTVDIGFNFYDKNADQLNKEIKYLQR